MNEIITLLSGDVPAWAIVLFFIFLNAVQKMPEPKDVPEASRWWYQWLFDVAHLPAGNWKLVAKAWRQRKG
ncbi:MAG TPA: hypothetical protein VFI02_19285 [Armatimonadota bacterium]|nr:hypothetical protein [Armatimonadota bacterium]